MECIKPKRKQRLVIGVTGASGAPLAEAVMKQLKLANTHEIHLVISEGGKRLLQEESDPDTLENIYSMADVIYNNHDSGASIASGSFKTEGMIIVPCSMKTLAAIRMGYASSLLLRAADVTIKENRRLILVPRETPLSPIHLDNMAYLATIGVTILPPVIGFYYRSKTIADMINQLACKIIEPFVINPPNYIRWGNTEQP